MPTCNATLSNQTIGYEAPLWNGGPTFHHFGLFFCAVFGGIALCVGMTLILLHASHYLKPWEQRHIIRILLLIPIYSVVSFLSYLEYTHAIYFDILEGCYEAFAISSFFTLLCHYVAPNLHDQKEFFRSLKPVNWFWGVFGLQYLTGGQNKGMFRKPRSGLTWFNIIWVGVFQYCFIRVFFSIVAVLAQIGDVYCEDSLSPAFAHIWVTAFECISVTIAMFCLVQFYIQLKDDLAEHRPFLKVLCIKLVIFFSFWQTIVISLASSTRGPLQPTRTLAGPDIRIGIPSMLLCIEMAIFAVMHIFAFSWKPYSIKHSYSNPLSEPGFSGGDDLHYLGFFPALLDAFNPWDIVKMTARGFRWLFVGVRKRHEDPSYHQDDADFANGKGGPGYAPVAYKGAGGQEGFATELLDSKDDAKVARGRTNTFDEDDRAGLLTHQGRMGLGNGGDGRGRGPYPSKNIMPDGGAYTPVSEQSQIDLGAPPPPSMPRGGGRQARQQGLPYPADDGFSAVAGLDAKPSDFDFDEDTAYHPGQGPAAGAARTDAGGALHPAHRSEDVGEWPLSNDLARIRPPPAYPTSQPDEREYRRGR